MGCDIHMHIEVKIAGRWEHYAMPDIDRNYALFEKMAGVRGDEDKAIAAPRGMPDDVSTMTRFCCDYDGSDGHSHSWLNAEEIATLAAWGEENLRPRRDSHMERWDMEWDWRCYLFGNSFAGFHQYPDSRPRGIEDLRFVFWFDN